MREEYCEFDMQDEFRMTTKFLRLLDCPDVVGPISLENKENAIKYIMFLDNVFKNLILPGLPEEKFRQFVVAIMIAAAAGTDCLKDFLDSEINLEMFKNERLTAERIIYAQIYLYALIYNLKLIITRIDNWEITVNSIIVRVMFSYIAQIKNLVDLNLKLHFSLN